MSKLKRQIKELEEKIEAEQLFLQHQCATLNEEIKTPAVLTTAIIGGFALGFLIGSKSNKKQTSLIHEIHSTANLLLPLLFL